ncbi:MAG: hypothetical protein WCC66_13205 [Rhizobiaceae bacterium]
MDWSLAISRNREQLRQIVLSLFTLAGMRVGGSLFTVPPVVLSAIMLVLRPAESAVRRLIILAAHGLALKPEARRDAPLIPSTGSAAMPLRAFPLFDPLKSFDGENLWDQASHAFGSAVQPFGRLAAGQAAIAGPKPVDAKRIGLRLNALMRALDDLPRQARRLVRWQAKRDALLKAQRPTRISPIRPGLPPGWRQRKIHQIDTVLRECHGLANDVLNALDTS